MFYVNFMLKKPCLKSLWNFSKKSSDLVAGPFPYHDDQAKETLYWGEYPLYFAACLGQEESYRLILARFVKSFAKDLQICVQLLPGFAHICKSTAKQGVFWRKGIFVSSISDNCIVSGDNRYFGFDFWDFLCHSCRGADPDSLDTNGNNICHMMVILNKV